MAIYGRETVRYTWNVQDDNTAVQIDTLDWLIEDTLLDGSNNDTTLTDEVNTDTQNKIYESSGAKHIHTEVDFNDGWDNIYQHETNLDVEALVYETPVLDFSWTPAAPTVLDTVEFTQEHDDIRDDTIPKQYGRIDRVDVDYYKDGTDEVVDVEDDSTFSHVFETKEDGIELHLKVEYWDGWQTQNADVTKIMNMSNIPPVSDSTREDAGVCIPAYKWTATSTDTDDAIDELTYTWKLYKKDDNDTPDDDTDDTWEEIDSGTEITYEYPFQYEGDYRLVLRTTDDEDDWHEKTEDFTITFDVCGSGAEGGGAGTIILQPNRFQMVAIPVPGLKVKEYFLDKVAEIIGDDASTVIELVKSYPSSDVSEKKFQVFVPDLTNPDSSTNFELMQIDGDAKEITAFYVKTKEFDGTIEVPWDFADGE